MGNWRVRTWFIRLMVLIPFPFLSVAQERSKFLPDALVIQHAGSIGYFSGGIGFDLFKNKKGSVELLYGHVPKHKGGRLDVLTAKFSYRPLSVSVKDLAIFYPVNPGVFFSYTFGEDLSFAFDNVQYSKGYYGWSESLRSHLSVSNELVLNGEKLFGGNSVKGVVVYSELNASDLYLVSWATNMEALSFFEIFKLGIGAKIKF